MSRTFSYSYSKLRKDFGRQLLFQDVPAQILDSICSDRQIQKVYILRNPVHRDVQATLPKSRHIVNTTELEFLEQGMNHTEGGWPREVHLNNEEALSRHRRRVCHEDNYIHTVLHLEPQVTHYVKQNNAINMYESYFSNMPHEEPVEKYNVQIGNTFRDPYKRPISSIAWTNQKKSKLVVSYCHKNVQLEPESDKSNICYVWDVKTQTKPINEFNPKHPCWVLACSPEDPDVILAGLQNGTVNAFDLRVGPGAISSSSVYNSHFGPITALHYIYTRTNMEFFTGSPDGQCLWWDMRDLSEPTNELRMSIRLAPKEAPSINNSESVSSLEYNRGLPTKFLCGTDSGLVINANRLGKSHSEILSSYWEAHSGPVRSLQRSPCTLRMFLTCGDWTVRVWSEEVRTAPIIVTEPYKFQVTDAVWAPLRFSSYMVTCEDGVFYYWDFLRQYRKPVATLKVSNHALSKVVPHPNGHSVAVGDVHGSLYLLQLSDNMAYPGPRDKALMNQTYQRETKREHILDNRIKELRLKAREELPSPEEPPNYEEIQKNAEEDYFKIITQELQKMEADPNLTEFNI